MSERPASPGAGETLGRYRIESLLGRGGMGAVYLATDQRLERRVALKVIAPELSLNDEFRARFLRESQLAASLDHPNVIPIYDADEIDGVLYLAMRYVSGPSLQEQIRRQESISPGETLRLAEQIGGALDAAHRADLVHRDVKPANILVEATGHAYLCDFGLAKRTTSPGTTQRGSFLGSVDYAAPEQIEGGRLDGRADIYSLGCVLFHCLVGHPPFPRETEFATLQAHALDPPPAASHERPNLPSSLDGVIAVAMAKDAGERYQTAGVLASAVRDALAGGAAHDATRVAPPGVRPARVQARRRLLIAAAVLVAASSLVAGAFVLAGSNDAESAGNAQLRTFVDRIENVLDQSGAGRDEIATAITAGRNCSIAPQEAGRRIASVADNRQSILGQLGTIPTPSQQADDVVTSLQRALQQSIEADRHYRDGFARVGANRRCPLPQNADFALAAKSDAQATKAKRAFVAAFNPLAAQFHRRMWTPQEI